MREAVGGTLLFYIIIIFLFVYIVFIGVIMNYASTYRAGNYIVSNIEEYEADVDVKSSDFKKNFLDKYHYTGNINYCCKDNSNGSIYQVTTYVGFEIPLFNIDLDLPIKLETKTIYGVHCAERINNFSVCE